MIEKEEGLVVVREALFRFSMLLQQDWPELFWLHVFKICVIVVLSSMKGIKR